MKTSPWYAATVIGVIAVTLALATTTFAIVDGVVFRPLPYPTAERLVSIQPTFKGLEPRPQSISAVDLSNWQAAVPEVPLTAFRAQPFGGYGRGVNDDAAGVALVQENFFDVIGVRPWLGGFAAGDFADTPKVRPVIVMHTVWQTRYQSNPAAIGQVEIVDRVGGYGFRVVGVMPPGFSFPSTATQVDFLSPLVIAAEQRTNPQARSLSEVVARLPAGMEPTVLAEGVALGVDATREQFPARGPKPPAWSEASWKRQGPFDGVVVTPLAASLSARSRPMFLAATAAVALLLLIACANVASLMSARALERRAELDLRRALGASTGSIARLWMLESLSLVAVGSVVGLGLAVPLLEVILRVMPTEVVLLKPPFIDARVAGFLVVMVGAVAALVSVAPIRQSLRLTRSAQARAASERTRTPGKFVAISTQVAAALVLTVAGTSLVGSLLVVYATDLPVRTDGVVAVNLMLQGPGASMSVDPARVAREQQMRTRLGQIPGVQGVTTTAAQVLSGGGEMSWFVRPPGASLTLSVDTWSVTEGFYDVLEPQLVEGRVPTNDELRTSAPIVVVTDTVARGYWPGASALGQSLKDQQSQQLFTVVGVVKDVRWFSWDREGPVIYAPYATTGRAPWVTFFLRTDRNAGEVIEDAIQAIASVDPFTRPRRAAPLSTLFRDTVSLRRFQSWLFGTFAAVSLVVVGVGILGLLAMSTARRTREVGIRCALGSTPAAVAGLLLREQLRPVIAGVAVGSAAAVWAVQFVESYLYELSPGDPRIWATAVLLIIATAGAGALIPAVRASRVDPLKALRVD